MSIAHAPRIWDKRVPAPNSYVRILRNFLLSNPPRSVTLTVTADSDYAVWVNGAFAGSGQYGDFPADKVCDEIEIAPLLRQGENVLAILAYCTGEDCSVYVSGKPGAAFEVTAGKSVLCRSDGECITSPAPEYVSGEIHRFSGQLSFGFAYDAAAYDGWHDDGYVPDGSWEPAEERDGWEQVRPRPIARLERLAPPPAKLLSGGEFRDKLPLSEDPAERVCRAGLSLVPVKELTGVSVREARTPLTGKKGITFTVPGGDGIYCVLDLGKETPGLFTLELDAPADTRIDIGFGEHILDGRVRSKIGPRSFAGSYRCREGRQQFIHHFKRLGCRYVELHVCAKQFTLYYAGVTPVVYPLQVRGAFSCSDRLHEMIYDTCVDTLRACMHEHYEDCPWREQALYTMDSRNQMLCGYYAFGEYAFPRASLRLFADAQRPDGQLDLTAPGGRRDSVVIPSYSLIYINQCMEYTLYSGDLSLAREVLPVCEKILGFFAARRDADGLPAPVEDMWNFYEWADGLDGSYHRKLSAGETVADAALSAFYSLALGAMQKLCRWIGRSGRAYAAEQKAVNAALDRIFWCEDKGAYATYVRSGAPEHFAELTQSLFIACGACKSAKRRRAVLEKLAREDNGLVKVTLSHSIFKYEALLTRRCYAPGVFDEIARKWGGMLRKDATTFWETEDGADAFDDAGSLCHAWSAAPAYLYFAYVLGIRPRRPGFRNATKKPLGCNILRACGTVPTPRGEKHYLVRTENGTTWLSRHKMR